MNDDDINVIATSGRAVGRPATSMLLLDKTERSPRQPAGRGPHSFGGCHRAQLATPHSNSLADETPERQTRLAKNRFNLRERNLQEGDACRSPRKRA
jgi:high-affinity K+ transport system ATPase subunit B